MSVDPLDGRIGDPMTELHDKEKDQRVISDQP